jgi:hypothetical protein
MVLHPASGMSSSLGELLIAIDAGDEIFWEPQRLVPFEHWVGHIPFAFWLIKALRPRRIVELGTHRGNSYCAFCQAISTLELETRASAVDTWQGDVHMSKEDGIYEELSTYHDSRYSQFSNLLRMSFDEARGRFGEGTIDLLHIDGTHVYEAVRHDFESWLGALSPRGVVLFHDTTVKQSPFGVWKLWQELASQYPSFEFHHSYGLGVLGVGPAQAPHLMDLYTQAHDGEAAARIRSLFSARGEVFALRLVLADANTRHDQDIGAERQRIEREAETKFAQELIVERKKARQWLKELQATHLRQLATEREQARYHDAVVRATLLETLRASSAKQAEHELSTSDAIRQACAEAEKWRILVGAMQSRVDSMEKSTVWQMAKPARRISGMLPMRMRKLVRNGIRFAVGATTEGQ